MRVFKHGLSFLITWLVYRRGQTEGLLYGYYHDLHFMCEENIYGRMLMLAMRETEF